MEQPSNNGTTARDASEVPSPAPQQQYSDELWQTSLGTGILAAVKGLFAEELAEIERARKDRERALKAHESARREVALLQNRLSACVAALTDLPHRTPQIPHESHEDAAFGIREDRERLWAEQDRLRVRLIEAKARAAKLATDERQETDRFARRARRAHARTEGKRNEVHAYLEQVFKEVDDRLAEAWSVTLGSDGHARE